MTRNSDGSYDAVDSGGFGKDYHGQDAFGERIGGTGIGGSHFGGFEEGHVGLDKDNTDKYEKLSPEALAQTESMPKSAFEADNGNESEEEASSGMKDSLRDLNSESSEEGSNVSSTMDTSLRIGGIEENEAAKEKVNKAKEKMDHLEQSLSIAEEKRQKELDSLDKLTEDLSKGIDYFDKGSHTSLAKDSESLLLSKTVSGVEKYAKAYGFEIDEETKAKMSNPSTAPEAMRDVLKGVRDMHERTLTKEYDSIKSQYDDAKSEYETAKDNYDKRLESSFTDKMKPSTEAKPGPNMASAKTPRSDYFTNNTDLEKAEEDLEKNQQELKKAEERVNRAKQAKEWLNGIEDVFNSAIDQLDSPSIIDRIANKFSQQTGKTINSLADLANTQGYDGFDINKLREEYKEKGVEALRDAKDELFEELDARYDKEYKSAQASYDRYKSLVDSYKSPTTDKTKTSFTDKMKPSTEAKPGPNMSKATVGESDYLTKANKDSTKELPKETPSRNDFGNHAADTLKGVTDRIADNTTAKALGIQSLEDFAKEKGVDPNKLSTMKAYRSYQNKKIWKATPNIMKKVGGYFFERLKDAVDPTEMGERALNTLARYNPATLIGAVILSIMSGAGLQASIDQVLTMVDPEDQPDISDYLEDVLNDEGIVADLSNAIDDALAPQQNSNTAELDESIINVGIGRKDNTDYSDFNAGLGTTSDADVKVFIARNVKADPILRRMISKIGK